MANNVGYGEIYTVSDWGTSPRAHLRSIIAYATEGLAALVRLTIDNTLIKISSIFYKTDQTIDL